MPNEGEFFLMQELFCLGSFQSFAQELALPFMKISPVLARAERGEKKICLCLTNFVMAIVPF